MLVDGLLTELAAFSTQLRTVADDLKAVSAAAGETTKSVKEAATAVDALHTQAGISETGASGDLGSGAGTGGVVSGLTNALKAARR